MSVSGSEVEPEKSRHFAVATLVNFVVSREGLEPSTPGLKGPCSNQLSYRPNVLDYTIIFGSCEGLIVGAGQGDAVFLERG